MGQSAPKSVCGSKATFCSGPADGNHEADPDPTAAGKSSGPSLVPTSYEPAGADSPQDCTAAVLPAHRTLTVVVVLGLTLLAVLHIFESQPASVRVLSPGATPSASWPTAAIPAGRLNALPRYFDWEAARAAMRRASSTASACDSGGSGVRNLAVRVTFEGSGFVKAIYIDQPQLRATATAACIQSAFSAIRISRFDGSPITLDTTVALR